MPDKYIGTGQPLEEKKKIEKIEEKNIFSRQIPGQPPGVQPGGSPTLCWLPPVRAPAPGPGRFDLGNKPFVISASCPGASPVSLELQVHFIQV